MCRAVWCRPRRYGDPTTEYRISTSSVEKSYTRRLEPLWLYEIILSEHLFERYQAPLTRKARVAPHTEPVLILLPPSEKKAAAPAPAIELYTGVLYAALGWSTLSKTQQKMAQQSIVIISAKYGALRPLDPIEPYKEKIVNKEMAPKVAAILWGNHAKQFASLFDPESIVESAHPSPLSASRGFLGSKPFSRVNSILAANQKPVINW